MTTTTSPGVTDDGSVDVTAAILAFVASCADGTEEAPNTILFGTDKTYRVDGILLIDERHHLIIDGGGSTFTTAPTTAASAPRRSARTLATLARTCTPATPIRRAQHRPPVPPWSFATLPPRQVVRSTSARCSPEPPTISTRAEQDASQCPSPEPTNTRPTATAR